MKKLRNRRMTSQQKKDRFNIDPNDTNSPAQNPSGPQTNETNRSNALVDCNHPVTSGTPDVVADLTANLGLAQKTAQAWAVVQDYNDPPTLFTFDEDPVRMDPTSDGGFKIRPLTAKLLKNSVSRIIPGDWTLRTGVRFTQEVIGNMLAEPIIPLPALRRIVACPTFGADGTLQVKPGYCPKTQAHYAPAQGFSVPLVPAEPSTADIARANEVILGDLLYDFPFSSDAEWAHAVALLLLPFVRDMIAGPTPIHLIEAPQAGTGKSLLAEALMYLALGVDAKGMTEPQSEDEWRKLITSSLRNAPEFVFIDNIRDGLDSSALSAATTLPNWSNRLLGGNNMVSTPVRCVWVMTGNNPTLTPEVARRTCRIRLDSETENPWTREGFKHRDLLGWIRSKRSELVWSALVMIQAWIAKGRPEGQKTLGTYEIWARVMGGILDVNGITGFLDNTADIYMASNTESAGNREFVEAWWARFGDRPVGAKDLFDIVQDLDTFDLGDGSDKSQRTRLGGCLQKMRDQQFGSYRIETAGTATSGPSKNAKTYRLGFITRPAKGIRPKGNLVNQGNVGDPKLMVDALESERVNVLLDSEDIHEIDHNRAFQPLDGDRSTATAPARNESN